MKKRIEIRYKRLCLWLFITINSWGIGGFINNDTIQDFIFVALFLGPIKLHLWIHYGREY